MNTDIELINAPKGAMYVNEFMRTLPDGIFNKKNTGCGATSLMIENDQPVIICCPTQQLVNNKVAQYPNDRCGYVLLGVLEGVYESDIKAYIVECEGVQPVKIMVTYNSFGKVSNALGDKIQDYKIIVDEYQELLDSVMYRDKVILKFLQELQDVQHVTYLSATPIPNEFIPNELIGLKQYEINWGENQVIITPHRIEVDSPFLYISRMIIGHRAGNSFSIKEKNVKEYFFYVNSVSAINTIIKKVGLTNDDVNIICADNAKNRTTLGDIKIGSIPKEGESNKPFTFCTKTAFCGVDFFSKAGLTVVVSDGKHTSTMLDVSTDIRQIAGRIRNEDNLFKHAILHVYNTGYILDIYEFERKLSDKIADAERDIKSFECLKKEEKGYERSIIEKVDNDSTESFVIYDELNKKMYLNDLKIKYNQWKFETIHAVYANGLTMSEAYAKDGFNIEEAIKWEQKLRDFMDVVNKTPPFKSLYEEYCVVMENKPEGFAAIPQRAKDIESINPLVAHAYQFLTIGKVKALRYNVTDIKNEVRNNMPETKEAIKSILKDVFREGSVYTNAEAKAIIKDCYKKLRINAKAKTTDLVEYFDIKKTKVTIEDKRMDGVKISKIHFIYTRSKYRLQRM
ncbi:DEAD/DEAH box helicase family protein [Dysgonomonas sp. ZJ709]|uniref:DEAD/DEAH box helicase family protein n=1 Tax=Dysgonomonas sp. ZJ709 TaxID=2709797 RepID=UPI0013EAAA44|nr:DEAD/DEAH box helicase family protein [Dysgonomonas sp. ZJ709]